MLDDLLNLHLSKTKLCLRAGGESVNRLRDYEHEDMIRRLKKHNLISEVFFLSMLVGALAAALIVIMAFATGQTFGQRCAVEFENKSPEWRECVSRLSKGGEINR